MQTAHEPSYLVKHLLSEMPPVTTRVQMMRSNQAPQSQSENRARSAQSNVRWSPASHEVWPVMCHGCSLCDMLCAFLWLLQAAYMAPAEAARHRQRALRALCCLGVPDKRF